MNKFTEWSNTMHSDTLQVLLSTYNGEAYIGEQLDSIFKQQNAIIHILIRDDGSSDSTVAIIQEYIARYPKQIQLIEGDNIGVVRSFWALMKHADREVDYFCFCDQDDVWMPDKASRAIQKLHEMESSNPKAEGTPAMICTATQLTNQQLEPTAIWPRPLAKEPSFYNALIQNIAVGATMSFNRRTLELVLDEGSDTDLQCVQMHDWWIYLVVSSLGHVYFDSNPSIFYRQHENNAVGGEATVAQKMKKKWRSYRKHKHQKLLVRQASEFKRVYGRQLHDLNMIFQLDAFIAPRPTWLQRIRYLNSCTLYRQSRMENVLFRFLIISGYI